MRYQDIDDLYRTRRTPWIPILLGVGLAVAAVVYFTRNGGSEPRSPDPGEPPAAATRGEQTAGASNAVVAAAAEEPADPNRPAYPAGELNSALAAIRQLEAQDKLAEARDKLQSLVEDPRSLGALQSQVESRLAAANLLLVTTPRPMPGKVDYTIQRGDSLSKIAAKFNCPAELIQKANRIANERVIRPGDVIRVLDHPSFAIDISKRRNSLLVTLGGKFFKRYPVGTGAYGKTPEGTFIVRDKIVQPPWWRADGKVVPFGDPENILGTRWMALQSSGPTKPVGGYGIHGTWDEASIGKQSSAGCVRMRNADVEEVFMLVPRGTPVTIRE
jgi:lipoprotein-anchoring transpeptidase ErfK/SrfK